MDFFFDPLESMSGEKTVEIAIGPNGLPWSKSSKLVIPNEEKQQTIPTLAEYTATKMFLKSFDLTLEIVERWNAEDMAPGNKLPLLVAGDADTFLIAGFEQICAYTRKSILADVSNEDESKTRIYIDLIKSVLTPIENYFCWIDENNYNSITKERYGFEAGFPLNKFLPFRKRLKIKRWLREKEYLFNEEKIEDDLESCLNSLNCFVQERMEIGANQSTVNINELDCLIYGHVKAILKISLPNNFMQATIQRYVNLLDFTTWMENKICVT